MSSRPARGRTSTRRLRGALGPLAFLPVLPLGTMADQAGKAARTSTGMVAAASLAVLTFPATVALPSSFAEPRQTRTPEATPTATPTPVVVVDPPPPPPAALGRLFLADGGVLSHALPTEDAGSTVVLRPGGLPALFSRSVLLPGLVRGAPTVVLHDRLVTRAGKGNPKGTLSVLLLDCPSGQGPCRTLSSGAVLVGRYPRGWQKQTARLSSADAVVPPGHVLRLSIALRPHRNIVGVVLGYGGVGTPSRLEVY